MLIGTVQELMFLWKTSSRSLEFNADNENAYLQGTNNA